jgi:hypothetical protein
MPLTLSEQEALDEQLIEHPLPTKREQFKAALARRYSPRMHMSLILMASGLASMVTSWTLLHAGVHSMVVRYPIAITLAYAVFLLGVWTWLCAMGFMGSAKGNDSPNARKSKGSGLDIDLPSGGGGGGGAGGGGGSGVSIPRGGGGSFDGGGASASFADGRAPMIMNLQAQAPDAPTQVAASAGKSGGGFDLGGIDGDGIVLIVLAIALVAVIFVTSGYLIWSAPDVLTEAAFGAALTGTLSRPTAAHASSGWVAGVVKKTWWPYALVLLAAIAFACYAGVHYPEAHTFKQAIHMAVAG